MLDRSHAEAVIYRVAVASFTYYPTKSIDEPGYTLEEDVEWCMAPLRSLPWEVRAAYRDRIARHIADSREDHRALVVDVTALADA